MSIKIVSDSSSNILEYRAVEFASVPMKVIAGEKEYVDNLALNLDEMVSDLRKHKGPSGSSCPNVQEWLDAFADADEVFAVTISKNLSGSYNSASEAARQYMERYPDRKVFVLDSLAAGPQQAMVIDKLKDLILEGYDFETIKEKALDYHNHTHILFCLESLMNLARNGRINPAVAKIAGAIGIRVIGDVKGGEITPVQKPRGEKKAMSALVDMLQERGLRDGGYVRIAHCQGFSQACALKEAVLERMPNVHFVIEATTALCSFYAEAGGLMIGFEGDYNTNNNNRDF